MPHYYPHQLDSRRAQLLFGFIRMRRFNKQLSIYIYIYIYKSVHSFLFASVVGSDSLLLIAVGSNQFTNAVERERGGGAKDERERERESKAERQKRKEKENKAGKL